MLFRSLFYTLTVMLIAQIFFLKVGFQGYANLLLLSWIGVVAFAYIFDSKVTLIIGMIELLFWVHFQYLSFLTFSSNFFREPSFGMIALIDLAFCVIFYGIALLHRSFEHKFSRTYQFWSLFYVLCFAYILSFQMLLPMLWSAGFNLAGGGLAFVLSLSFIAVVLFIVSALSAVGKNIVDLKEVFIFVMAFALFVLLIFSSSIVSSGAGNCYSKNCYQTNTQLECERLEFQRCEWTQNSCQPFGCHNYKTKLDCESSNKIDCMWMNNSYLDYSSNITIDSSYCSWNGSSSKNIQTDPCSKLENERRSCLSDDRCQWRASSYFGNNRGSVQFSLMIFWIFSNILFILIILGVIGYGYLCKDSGMINLGILFFILDIITRYIGFIIDYWGSGYNVMAVLFILGGIILLAGGWAIEKFRRRLLMNMGKGESSDNQKENEED